MNTTAHTLISSTIGLGLALFTFGSAILAGLTATSTTVAISLFVAYGVIEMMIQSYATPTGVFRSRRGTRPPGTIAPVVAEFRNRGTERKAA